MSVEIYVRSRNGVQSDFRSGSLAESPGDVTFTLNGTPLDQLIQLAVGDSLLIEVKEHIATAADQPTPTRPAPDVAEPRAASRHARKVTV